MSIFLLSESISFPAPHLAEKDGLLAVGGDLSVKRLLAAYRRGIFPWYTEGSPILWWSPDPRLVLFPDELITSRSLRQCIRKNEFRVTFNTAFRKVIDACAEARRKGQDGTWITGEMKEAYVHLHELGHALSAEAWHDGELAGGLYGVVLGRVFFGESMFTARSNASKVAFAACVDRLKRSGCRLIDCQMKTAHLVSLGAREIPRTAFLKHLKSALSPVPQKPRGI